MRKRRISKENIYDIVIIGAGIIGGATAYKLSENSNVKIAVIDKEKKPGIHQTGRNSGVIHSGVYYPKGSLKSKNCIDGYRQLVQFLKEFDVTHEITGKIIAAADKSEYPELERLYKNAIEVGLTVKYLNRQAILEIDQNIVAERAFLVQETGITDYKEVLNKFIEISSHRGVDFLFSTTIKKVLINDAYTILDLGETNIQTKKIVNCAGLQSDRVYEQLTNTKSPVTIIPFKGEYFHLSPKSYKSNIPIYPVPNREFPFLGIHLTRMVDGSLHVGPNAVLAFDREGYKGIKINFKDSLKIVLDKTMYNVLRRYGKTVAKELLKAGSKSFFEKSVRRYWSNFTKNDIIGYSCGIRAQATEEGNLLSDFRIEVVKNQVHILNAPSPAATSCLSIADTIIETIYSKSSNS